MKKVRVIFSVFAFALALGAAFATSKPFATEVWRQPTSGGTCSATTCLISASFDCSATGFNYYNNSSCLGNTISPHRN